MKCTIAYEVSAEIRSLKTVRSTVFVGKAAAKAFQRKWPGATLKVVELCDSTGKISRRGKRTF